jgi:hypothetical protein
VLLDQISSALRHGRFLLPASPMNPGKQAPQVSLTLEQPARFNAAHAGAWSHETVFNAADPTAIAVLVASLSPELEASWERMEDCSSAGSDWGDTVTIEDALAEAPKESNTWTKQLTAYWATEDPAGSIEELSEEFDFPCTVIAAPLLLDRKPNWKDRGKSGSLHCAAANAKLVESSTPPVGSTLNVPGSGGPLVVTLIDAADWAQVRVNNRVDRIGRAFAASTRFTARVESVAIVVLSDDRANEARSTVDLSTLHRAVHAACTVTEPLNDSLWVVSTELTLCTEEVRAITGAEGL